MPIFSSTQAAQAISAPPLPEVIETLPDITFRGTDCRSVTVTLENSVVYKDSSNKQVTRRMQKIYKVESSDIQRISIEVKLEVIKQGQTIEPLDTVFRLTVDPHLRRNQLMEHPNSTPGNDLADRRNPQVFIPQSVQVYGEVPASYEAYKLYLYNLKKEVKEVYKQPEYKEWASKYLDNNKILIEFKKGAPTWSFITISSLLSDLLESCPPFFLRLCIVGNYQFQYVTEAIGNDGKPFFKPEDFPPTGTPAAVVAADTEAKWNKFLTVRANTLKSFIFGPRGLNIVTSPAIKITPTSAGDKILDEDRNYLADLFQLPDFTPDIQKLKDLRLEKGKFGAGSIFLWIIASLHDTEINFQTNRATVYPTATNNNGPDWKTVADNNLARIKKLREDLFFLVPGSSNTRFTTNLTDLSLRVEGYTDTVASTTSNLTLSKSRAASVIQELINPTPGTLPPNVGGGIPASKFNPSNGEGYGETRLRVPTPNDTNELLNRRVLIRVVGLTCTP